MKRIARKLHAWWLVPLPKPIVCRACAERRTHLNRLVVYVHRSRVPYYCPNGCAEELQACRALSPEDITRSFGEAS